MDIDALLDRFAFIRNAPPALRKEIRAAIRPIRLEAGEYVYRRGDRLEVVALVAQGDIRVFALGEGGREITLYHVAEGDTCLLNLLCAYLKSPAPASAQTETTVEALVLPADAFRRWVGCEPTLQEFLFGAMAERIFELLTLVQEVAFRRVDERLSAYLATHFAAETGPVRALTATHEGIAAELGTAREVVSRLLKEFERRGAVHITRGRIELVDAARLGSEVPK